MYFNEKQLMSSKIFPILILLLFSCEGGTDAYWELVNTSDLTVKVQLKLLRTNQDTTFVLGSLERKIVYVQSSLGGSAQEILPEDVFANDTVRNANNDTLKLDFLNLDNWQTQIVHKSKYPSHFIHDYKIVIGDEDF